MYTTNIVPKSSKTAFFINRENIAVWKTPEAPSVSMLQILDFLVIVIVR